MGYNVLLVEDDEQLQEIITDYFSDKSKGEIHVTCVGTGLECDEKFFEQEFDLILLDVMLPDTDGFTICKSLRKHNNIPIVFMTARHSESDRLYGYELGCDDYVSKPFSLAELYVKVLALIKRDKGIVGEETVSSGAIMMNLYRRTVFVNGKEISLTPKVYAILRILITSRGRMVSREQLLVKVWGYDFEGNERVVDNHVKKLRRALGSAASQIKTVVKIGYKLEG